MFWDSIIIFCLLIVHLVNKSVKSCINICIGGILLLYLQQKHWSYVYNCIWDSPYFILQNSDKTNLT